MGGVFGVMEQTVTTGPVDGQFDVRPGRRDIGALTGLVRSGLRVRDEASVAAGSLNGVVVKPWGYESRVFWNDFLDVWHLSVEPGTATSVHAHPRKTTWLLCLSGRGVVETLGEGIELSSGVSVRVLPAAFHGTHATGQEGLHLVEVEAPRNKLDLVRLRDSHNRPPTQYETAQAYPDAAGPAPLTYLPNSWLRPVSPEGLFSFGIRSGTDLFYRPLHGDLFHVPLDLEGVLNGNIAVVAATRRDPARFALDGYYLSVARA
jgi:mannose-6-phosphate isomerase-like protein (cupin superfamily)